MDIVDHAYLNGEKHEICGKRLMSLFPEEECRKSGVGEDKMPRFGVEYC
jgi:hypothetical protein